MKQTKVFFYVLFLLVSLESSAQCYFTQRFIPPNFCTDFAGFSPFENIINNNSPFQVIATANGTGLATVCTSIHPSITSLRGAGSGCVVFLVLPVTLISFTGTLNNDHSVSLNWHTAEEKNNAGFEIERSLDGHAFTSIGFVPANDFSQGINHYTYKDIFPETGKNYYRFKQIDHDGSFTYSHLVYTTNYISKKITVSPNPVTHFLEIKGDDDSSSEYLIYNSNGILLFHTPQHIIDVSSLRSGLYMIKNNDHSLLFIKE